MCLLDDPKHLLVLQQVARENRMRWGIQSPSVGKAQTDGWFSETYRDDDQRCKRVEYRVGGCARVYVCEGDWGDVAQKFTQRFGRTFAVLNMANAYVAGGGVVDGMIAQEENMYRRTDCWPKARDSLTTEDVEDDKIADLIYKEPLGETATIDSKNQRVCLLGMDSCGDDRDKKLVDRSYVPLSNCEVFPFTEIKAAAFDTRKRKYNSWSTFMDNYFVEFKESMNRRIENQFQQLVANEVRYVVLSAFGCGAFINKKWPESKQIIVVRAVAQMYFEAIDRHGATFDVIAFGIYDSAGYGKTQNSRLFHEIFDESCRANEAGGGGGGGRGGGGGGGGGAGADADANAFCRSGGCLCSFACECGAGCDRDRGRGDGKGKFGAQFEEQEEEGGGADADHAASKANLSKEDTEVVDAKKTKKEKAQKKKHAKKKEKAETEAKKEEVAQKEEKAKKEKEDKKRVEAKVQDVHASGEGEKKKNPPRKCNEEIDRLLGLWSATLSTAAFSKWSKMKIQERAELIGEQEMLLFSTMVYLENTYNIDWSTFSIDAVNSSTWDGVVAVYNILGRHKVLDNAAKRLSAAASGEGQLRKFRSAEDGDADWDELCCECKMRGNNLFLCYGCQKVCHAGCRPLDSMAISETTGQITQSLPLNEARDEYLRQITGSVVKACDACRSANGKRHACRSANWECGGGFLRFEKNDADWACLKCIPPSTLPTFEQKPNIFCMWCVLIAQESTSSPPCVDGDDVLNSFLNGPSLNNNAQRLIQAVNVGGTDAEHANLPPVSAEHNVTTEWVLAFLGEKRSRAEMLLAVLNLVLPGVMQFQYKQVDLTFINESNFRTLMEDHFSDELYLHHLVVDVLAYVLDDSNALLHLVKNIQYRIPE